MAKSFFGENSMRFMMKLVKGALGEKVDATSIADNLTTEDETKVLSAKQGKVLSDQITQVSTDVTSGITEKIGKPEGIAPLDESGKISEDFLPSYVDDVIEGYAVIIPGENEGDPGTITFYEDADHTTEITGEGGKIYLDLTTNASYRWSGSTYLETGSPMVEITEEEVQTMWDAIVVPDTTA